MTTRQMLVVASIALAVLATGFCIGATWSTAFREKSCKSYCEQRSSKDWKDVGGNIDIEYYLEVSEDSIWIENYNTHRVYGGKYSQLDSLINVDNL